MQPKCPHDHRNDAFNILQCHNEHCSAVEVLYYMTHYFFRQAQDFSPLTPPDYPEFRCGVAPLHAPPCE